MPSSPSVNPAGKAADPPLTPSIITILYTVSLRGQLELLPSLFTRIKRERAVAPGVVLLVDLGESCIPNHWLCDATAGRALFVAMDSMGYDAFYLDNADPLYGDAITLGKLRSILLTPIVTDSQSVLLTKRDVTGQSLALRLMGAAEMLPEPDTTVSATLRLKRGMHSASHVEAVNGQPLLVVEESGADGMLGRLTVALTDDPPFRVITDQQQLTAEGPPDPTISSVVEFVESEARYASRNQK